MWYDIEMEYSDYNKLAEADQWRGHRTAKVLDLFATCTQFYARLIWMLTPNSISGPTTGQFYSRENNRKERDRLLEEGFGEWHPDIANPKLSESHAESLIYTSVSRYRLLIGLITLCD